MAIHSPFDLQYWFLQVFAGTSEIFMAVAFLAIALLSGKLGLPNVVTFTAFTLFILMLPAYALGLPILAVLVLGLIIGFLLSRIWK